MAILNLCDIDFHWKSEEMESLIKESEKRNHIEIEKVYVGSYFCGNYFEFFYHRYIDELKNVLKKINVSIVLVVPIFSQSLLNSGKEKIVNLLKDGDIKSVVVNDLGMLAWIAKKKNISITLGRLFSKDIRDVRFPKLYRQSGGSKLIDGGFNLLRKEFPSIDAIELDNIYKNFDSMNQTKIVLHFPYVYQSVGHICCYANIDQDKNAPFLPNRPCNMNCKNSLIQYGHEECKLLRVGRAVFFENSIKEKSRKKNMDIAYWPLDLWREEYEHTGTFTRI